MIFKIFSIFLTVLFFLSTWSNKNQLFNTMSSSINDFDIRFNTDIQTLKKEVNFLYATKKELPFSGYKVDGDITYFDIDGMGVYFKNITSYPNQFSFFNLKEAKENLNLTFDNSLLYIVYNNIRSYSNDRKIIYTDDFNHEWVKILQKGGLSLTVFQDRRSIARDNTEFALYNFYTDKTYKQKMFTIILPEYDYFNNSQRLRSLWYFDFSGDFFAKNAKIIKKRLNLNVTIIDGSSNVVYTTNSKKELKIENTKNYYVFSLEKTSYKILIEKENFFYLIKLKEISLILLALISLFYLSKKEKLKKEVSSLKLINKIKSELLLRDPLTSLYNRYFLQEEMKFPLKNCGVVILDIDNFKNINDTFGHDKGDHVLRGVSNCIKLATLSGAYAFRWGGEEFLIIFEDISKDRLLENTVHLQQLIRGLKLIDNYEVTASFGVILTDIENKTEFYSAVSKADQKLYIAKNNGKDKIVFF